MTSARLTVTRRSPDDIGQRQIVVRLDGAELATLKVGGDVTREIQAGRHELKVDNTLFRKSVELDLQPGEHARFRVVNRSGCGTWLLQAAIGVGPIYLTIEREDVPR